MSSRVIFGILLFITLQAQAQSDYINLMPMPGSVSEMKGQLRLPQRLIIQISTVQKDSLLEKSIIRFRDKVLIKSKNSIHVFSLLGNANIDSATFYINVQKCSLPVISANESYSLSVSEKRLLMVADNTIGAIRGLESILQLISGDDAGYFITAVEIKDSPRFPWRGLMIDVARHFIPIGVLKRNIEAMSEVKLNVLHLHLSDNEGFRFESLKFPELQNKGSNGKFYKQSELIDLVAFAMERGIIIVPEFDVPGHSRSWFAGYPELASSPGPYKPGPGYEQDPANPVNANNLLKYIKSYPTPAMDPSRESTFDFLESFFTEVCHVFPSPFIHIGADENNGVVWKSNPAISEFMVKHEFSTTDELQAYFTQRVEKIITKLGRATIGWDEIYTSSISRSVIVQVWDTRAPKTKSVEILRNGNSEINSRGYYLDLFMPAFVHYLNDPLPYNCPDSLKIKFLGGEAAIWTELADEDNIEGRIWPRTAAIAERLWSPARMNDVNDMYRRLFILNKSLAHQGLQHEANYSEKIRNLSGNGNFAALKTLIDLLSPVKGYKRVMALFFRPGSESQPASLDEITDIARVDPEAKRKFRIKVASYLGKPTSVKEKELREILYSWSKNSVKIDSLLRSNPSLKAIVIHSDNLGEVARIGIKALDYLHMKIKPPISWSSDKLAVLKAASEPQAEVELSIIPEIEALVKQKLSPEMKGFPTF